MLTLVAVLAAFAAAASVTALCLIGQGDRQTAPGEHAVRDALVAAITEDVAEVSLGSGNEFWPHLRTSSGPT